MLKVFLHIGVHKTGSSSIQSSLKKGGDALKEVGIFYPDNLSSNHSSFFMSAFSRAPEQYHANKRFNRSREDIREEVRAQKHHIQDALQTGAYSQIVFSAEDACVLMAPEIKQFRNWIETMVPDVQYKILLYSRHPVNYVASAVQENVKGNGLTISQAKELHIRNSQDRYKNIFGQYHEVFPEATFVVRSFETEIQKECGLIGSFLANIDLPETMLTHEFSNEGISDEAVRIISYVRDNFPDIQMSMESIKLLGEIRGSKGALLSRTDVKRIWSLSASDRDFLSSHADVEYNSPELKLGVGQALSDDFFKSLADIMPKFSPELRAAVLMYLTCGQAL